MVNINAFLNVDKSMIIAPAGYGKTQTIIEALKNYQGTKKVLALTHTHAGIASIREKANKAHINPTKYTLDTISSFALFLTNAFLYNKRSMPKPEDNNYFSFAITTATKLLKAKPVKIYLQCTYYHLIVDEYQDCTLQQHSFIIMLSEIMKTHLLGDYLQGIFDFNDIVDMNSAQQMEGFIENVQRLEEPWRWKNKNKLLGEDLSKIRSAIEQNAQLDFNQYKNIDFLIANNNYDIYDFKSYVYKKFSSFMNRQGNNSLLVIVPEKYNVDKFASRFQKQFDVRGINAFDDKWYYNCSKSIDSINNENALQIIYNILIDIFPKTIVMNWINEKYALKNKKNINGNYIAFFKSLSEMYSSTDRNFYWIMNVVKLFKKYYYRQCKHEKTNAIINAMKIADYKSISVYEGMKQDRDIARRIGRKIYGRYVGTALLTKGLEFDTVIVLNPNEFKNKKQLYVALTRATSHLIIISSSKLVKYN